MMLGLIRPDSGEVRIKGHQFTNANRHLLRHIGAIIERPDLYGYLSGWDNLRMLANLSGKDINSSRLTQVLELVGLRGREKDKVRGYSQGMKQRLGIAIALVHDPDLLILDEPTNGLDPQGIAEMRKLITSLSRDHGKTVMVSSHLLYEIEQVASRMLIIHKGKKITEGTVSELMDPDDTLFDLQLDMDAGLEQLLKESTWITSVEAMQPGSVSCRMHPDRMPEFSAWLVAAGAGIREIRSSHSLEAYFISLTHDAAHSAGTI